MQSPHQAFNRAVEAAQLQAIRDRFAQAALTGLLSNSDSRRSFNEIIADAWEIADQMMAARSKTPSTGNQ
jgi:hypothetical protein